MGSCVNGVPIGAWRRWIGKLQYLVSNSIAVVSKGCRRNQSTDGKHRD